MKTPHDLIKAYLKWAEYDPAQTAFVLGNGSYTIHKSCENIGKMLEYEPEGIFAAMYAKNFFRSVMQQAKVNAFNILSMPDILREEKELWALFCDTAMQATENRLLDGFYALTQQILPDRLIGEQNREKDLEILADSIDAVAEQLSKCNVDLFRRGGQFQTLPYFSTQIHVFNRLSECLISLESAKDGIYLCYISADNSADGYFGYFLRSNGNILSVNERVDEPYPGGHKNSRNGRWTEDKKYDIFPYNLISHEQTDEKGNTTYRRDYKGYAKDFFIDDEKLSFSQLPQERYMPIVVAMLLLNSRYSGKELSDLPLKYVDSLLPVNLALPLPGENALMIPETSAIALAHNALSFGFTQADVLDGSYGKKFTWGENKNAHHSEVGTFLTHKGIFEELYGDGFVLDTERLLEANRHIKYLPNTDLVAADTTPDAEFVGTPRRMEMIAYRNARLQLADYIREQMYKEYMAFGGTPAVQTWWDTVLKDSKDRVIDLCVKCATDPNYQFDSSKPLSIRMEYTKNLPYHTYDSEICSATPFNFRATTPKGGITAKTLCCLTGAESSIYFTFNISNWLGIQKILGDRKMPKIVQGYDKRITRWIGNPILNATDPVAEIGTPFERREAAINQRYWDARAWKDHFFNNCRKEDWYSRKPPATALPYKPKFGFSFTISFSKRGWAKLLKEKGVS